MYLGSLLCSDGTSGSELNRRLGGARETFTKLCRIWNHTGISTKRKLHIYTACVVTKLTHNLHALLLNAAAQRTLDAFHLKCLRRILHIPHSFYSHISNHIVLERAGSNNLSRTLLHRQLDLLHRLALRNDSDIMRKSVFKPGSFELNLPVGPKKRGRPKKLWAPVMFEHAVRAVGSQGRLNQLWQDTRAAKAAWKNCLCVYCK